jgi:uncharacterized protein YecE (DUF72 family)
MVDMHNSLSGNALPESLRLHVGCAGWSIPKEHTGLFPAEGSHLERYASRLPAVEINSSFYRPHRPVTYARWAATVPKGFCFAVKVPREITHRRQLVGAVDLLDRFLGEVGALGEKLGPLLMQLPPKLPFGVDVAGAFLKALRERFAGEVVCEPRHASWFMPAAEKLLEGARVARVAANPAVVPAAACPGGWCGLIYYRLHGSPQVYYSDYSGEYLAALTDKLLTAATRPVWCVFDNTARGAATTNALDLLRRLREAETQSRPTF